MVNLALGLACLKVPSREIDDLVLNYQSAGRIMAVVTHGL